MVLLAAAVWLCCRIVSYCPENEAYVSVEDIFRHEAGKMDLVCGTMAAQCIISMTSASLIPPTGLLSTDNYGA